MRSVFNRPGTEPGTDPVLGEICVPGRGSAERIIRRRLACLAIRIFTHHCVRVERGTRHGRERQGMPPLTNQGRKEYSAAVDHDEGPKGSFT
jgi:hypothetical protein